MNTLLKRIGIAFLLLYPFNFSAFAKESKKQEESIESREEVNYYVAGLVMQGKFVPMGTAVGRNVITSEGVLSSNVCKFIFPNENGTTNEVIMEESCKSDSSHQEIYSRSITKTNGITTDRKNRFTQKDGSYSMHTISVEDGAVSKVVAALPIWDEEKQRVICKSMKVNEVIKINAACLGGDVENGTLTRLPAEATVLSGDKSVVLPKYIGRDSKGQIISTMYCDIDGDMMKGISEKDGLAICVLKANSEIGIGDVKTQLTDAINQANYAATIAEVTPSFRSCLEKWKQGIFDKIHPLGSATSCVLNNVDVITDEKSADLFSKRTLLGYRLTGTLLWKSPLVSNGQTVFQVTYDAKNGAWLDPRVTYTNGTTYEDAAKMTWNAIGIIKELSK